MFKFQSFIFYVHLLIFLHYIMDTSSVIDISKPIQDKQNQNNVEEAGCDPPFELVGKSCYYYQNISNNYNDSVNNCSALNATLPVFYDFKEFQQFQLWWNTKNSSTEMWLGMVYNATTKRWVWLDGCPFQFFPGFWRDYWEPTSIGLNIYAKYGNNWLPAFSWVTNGSRTEYGYSYITNKQVCYKPANNLNRSMCMTFQQKEKIPNMCSNGEWLCAKDTVAGQAVATAVDADSCFCVVYTNQSFADALASCQSYGGFLTDIRSAQETSFLTSSFGILPTSEGQLASLCPNGYSYFNHSCFLYSDSVKTYNYLGVSAQLDCLQQFGGNATSIHSIEEMWFLDYLLMNTPSSIPSWYRQDLTCYVGGYRNSTAASSPWAWTDGSPYDFPIPFGGFPWCCQPDGNLGLAMSKDGLQIHDFSDSWLPFMCRREISTFPLWINMLSNSTNLDCNTSCTVASANLNSLYFAVLNSSGQLQPTSSTLKTFTTAGAICRKDRNPTPTIPFCPDRTCPTTTTSTTTVTTTTVTQTTVTPLTVTFQQKTCGQALARNAGVVQKAITTATVNSCSDSCSTDCGCLGFNFYSGGAVIVNCELLAANSTSAPFVCDQSWNFYERL